MQLYKSVYCKNHYFKKISKLLNLYYIRIEKFNIWYYPIIYISYIYNNLAENFMPISSEEKIRSLELFQISRQIGSHLFLRKLLANEWHSFLKRKKFENWEQD